MENKSQSINQDSLEIKLEIKSIIKYLNIAKFVAINSGNFLKKNYKKIYSIEAKGVRDIVTEIDKKSENMIKSFFNKYTPEINFYGEETGGKINGLSWVVDPLDGTKNYVHKIPYFGVSIALCNNLKPILAVINFPILKKLYWAIEGTGSYCKRGNKVIKLSTSKNTDISKSFIATGFPHSKSHLVSDYVCELEKILKNVSAVRRLGSAAYDLCSVAEGTFDAFWEYGLESWDMAAGALIAREAGAFLSTASGEQWNIKSNSIFVSNRPLATILLDLIKNSHKN
ncbi:MAG: inositol monophosphatase family protein [Exilispira sp.]